MTADAFAELVEEFDWNADWFAAWQEARQHLAHRFGQRDFGVQMIGRLAWTRLTEEQRSQALDQLFTTYFLRIAEEERERRLDAAAQSATSYADAADVGGLSDPLAYVDITDPFAEVTVNAQALSHVLAELDLLQHRLAMRATPQES